MAQRNVQFKKSLKLMHILVRLVNSVEGSGRQHDPRPIKSKLRSIDFGFFVVGAEMLLGFAGFRPEVVSSGPRFRLVVFL